MSEWCSSTSSPRHSRTTRSRPHASTNSARRRPLQPLPDRVGAGEGNTPFQWTKQVASHWGGTRNGAVVHWPKGIEARGEVRHQFHHVIDVAPTVLHAAGLPEPKQVHGVAQHPMEGVSMRYAFEDADAADRRETQYFEMFCNRGIYDRGLDRGDAPLASLDRGAPAAVRRRHVGALRHEHGLEPGTRSRGRDAREARGAQGAVHGGGAQVQRASARRPAGRALPPRDRRAPDAGHRSVPAALRRDVAPQRERHAERQEQVPLHHGTGHGAGGRSGGGDRLAGRRVRRLEPLPRRRPADVLLQPLRRPAVPYARRHGCPGRASTRCAWSSATTVAASGRAAR